MRKAHGVGVVCLIVTGWMTQAAVAASDTAEIKILVVRATKSNSDISPELRPLANSLKKQFNFTGFKLEKTQSKSMKAGDTWTTSLIGSFEATVKLTKAEEKSVGLEVVVKKSGKEQLDVPMTIARGKSSLIGGWKVEGEDVLILAISGA